MRAAPYPTTDAVTLLRAEHAVATLLADASDLTDSYPEVLGAIAETLASLGRQAGQFLDRTAAPAWVHGSEARMRAILEAALDCVVTIDEHGCVVEFNPAAERTFGYSRDDIIGLEMAELIVPPRLRDMHREGLKRYLATGQGAVLNRRIEITGMRADGTEFPV